MKKKSMLNDLLKFLPLLVIYIVIIISFSSDEQMHDEGRHMVYATNLTNGFYSNNVNPEIGNGPGYPLVIAAFVGVGAPLLAIKLLNALFLLMAIVFFFKSLSPYLQPIYATSLSYVLGLYPPVLKWMLFIHSEAFAIFLACGFLYFFMRLHTHAENKKLHIFLSASFLGILALTKVIFGYVIICLLLYYILSFILKRSKNMLHTISVLVVGFMFCIPFLFYTYTLTGKTFCWGTQGGELLYWRSTPFPNEFGDWVNKDVLLGNFENKDYYDLVEIKKNHLAFIQSLEPLSHVQRDSLYKLKAMENIKLHPDKFIKNTFASGLRILFNYPYSYTRQKLTTYFYVIPNTFLLVFMISSIYLVFWRPKTIPFEVRFIGLVSLIFIGGLTLLDGRTRHLLPVIPLLLYFIIFVHNRVLPIVLGKWLEEKNG